MTTETVMVRLSPRLKEFLKHEAQRQAKIRDETVTVSGLVRECVLSVYGDAAKAKKRSKK